ncbi:MULTISPECIES: DUF4254 domain-containing protein [unclassified Nocardia]|uniref:DUF4254 domain-containing protein n=1 Tax=unclassified Nocardia TaxID=2637762 RepID=UPI003442B7F3
MMNVGNYRMVPGRDMLLAACRGLPHDDHPMLEAAGELAQLHEIREQTPVSEMANQDRRRAQLVRSIDLWVALVMPVPSSQAQLHSETVGQLVDRLAGMTTQAFLPLSAAPEAVFYDAWVQLNELADSYQDLIDGLREGTRRLPGG